MEDPLEELAILTNCLKAGGLMKIGLYSEIARRDIEKVRKDIARLGIETTEEGMKIIRQSIINSSDEQNEALKGFNDFYTLSELRDLLFHVKENQFSITKIKSALTKLDLSFCGFENDHLDYFKQKYQGKDDLYDLKKWEIFEIENTSLFAGMYQFWCQKN